VILLGRYESEWNCPSSLVVPNSIPNFIETCLVLIEIKIQVGIRRQPDTNDCHLIHQTQDSYVSECTTSKMIQCHLTKIIYRPNKLILILEWPYLKLNSCASFSLSSTLQIHSPNSNVAFPLFSTSPILKLGYHWSPRLIWKSESQFCEFCTNVLFIT
jgi:hypothetical protein